MIRVRISGGVLTPAQWLALDRVAREYGNGTMRLTTRQTVQLHGVIKSNLKTTMKPSTAALLNTIAACGDVNRNVMCNPNPYQSRRPRRGARYWHARSPIIWCRTPAPIARSGSTASASPAARKRLSSRSTAGPICRENSRLRWRCRRRTTSTCSRTILATSPSLDEAGHIDGWNVTVGGGMGMTHGEPDTYPRTADVMGFCQTRRCGRHGGSGRHRAARLGRPRQPQARAAQIHDRGSRARRVPRRGRAAGRRSSLSRRGRTPSPRWATAMAGARATTAARTSPCSSRTAAFRMPDPARSSFRRCGASPSCATAIFASRRTRTSSSPM